MPRLIWSSSSSSSSSTATLPITTSLDLSALSALEDSCPRAQSLLQRIHSVESQLQQLRAERDTLQREFQSSTQAALNSALDSLATLVSNVTEADRLLLFWHHKTAIRPLRVAFKLLKPIGRDKEVHTLMARSSGSIRVKADEVSGAFELCGDVCQDSLIKVQELHPRTNDLVTVGIHGLQNDAEDLRGGYEKRKKDLQLTIDQKGVDAGEVRRQASSTRAQVREAEEQAQEAERTAESSKTVGGLRSFSQPDTHT